VSGVIGTADDWMERQLEVSIVRELLRSRADARPEQTRLYPGLTLNEELRIRRCVIQDAVDAELRIRRLVIGRHRRTRCQ
jgi:hypothetical protein